jgi:hypothetical protein
MGPEPIITRVLTRRVFLLGAAASVTTAILAACGGSAPSSGSNVDAQGTATAIIANANATAAGITGGATATAKRQSGTATNTTSSRSSATPSALANNGPMGWLGQGKVLDRGYPGVWFFQWTEANGNITGLAQSTGVAPSQWTVTDYATNPSRVHLLSYASGDK